MTFFDSFWPNFAATILGVMLGVPTALYLNRQFSRHQNTVQAAESRRRLNDAIDVLIGACDYNIKVLASVAELARSGKVMHNADLRVTTWDAIGAMFSANCYEPNLVQTLSHHWLRLRRLEVLNTEMFAREVGAIPAVVDEEMMLGLWGELYENAITLSTHAAECIDKLRRLKT